MILIIISGGSWYFFHHFNSDSKEVYPQNSVSSSTSTFSSSSSSPLRLSISGSNILDPNGNVIVLRGFNWGSWGTAQPQDASDNVSEGANVVRMPLRWWGMYNTASVDSRDDAAPGHITPTNLAELDKDIQWALSQHLWIDLFIDSDCGQNGTQDKAQEKYCDPNNTYGNKGNNFWTDPAMRTEFVDVWKFIANRYKNTPYIGMYEILPEPNPTGVDAADITQFYGQLMGAIRSIDPQTPFLIGPGNGYDIKTMETSYIATTTPIIYTGNLFVFTGKDQQSNISDLSARFADLINFRATNSVPVFIQQTGVRSKDDPSLTYASTDLEMLNKANVGWTWWTYREQGSDANGYGVYYQDNKDPSGWQPKTDVLNLISKYLKGGTN
jgi:hypothetical protein